MSNYQKGDMMIGWTTLSNQSDAASIASELIEQDLAVCVHIESPITAFYKWDGVTEKSVEYRLAVKFLCSKELEIRAWLDNNHPYDVYQWIVLKIDAVSEAYFNWAKSIE